MKMNKLKTQIAVLSTGLLVSAPVFALPPNTYEITDLMCESGAPVNEKESIAKGRILIWPGNFQLATEILKKQQTLPGLVLRTLGQNPEKLVLYVSTIGSGLEYQSGQGPCPEGDEFVVLGREMKPLLMSAPRQ